MNTPKEKKQQLKKSLSAKKGPVKGLRNVLAQPYNTQWPVLSNEKECCLEKLLSRLLPGLKREVRSVPWSQLRKLGKDERRAAKNKLCTDVDMVKPDDVARKFITFGVNAVTRDLEKDKLCSILLDSTVENLLIKHLVVMAQKNNVPILLVPFLKKVSLENMGFASVAMALKREILDTTSEFNNIHHEIVKFTEPILVPENITPIEDSSTAINTENVEIPAEEKSVSNVCFSLSTTVYKYRNNRTERIFVPPKANKDIMDNGENWGDFIAIGKDDTELCTPKPLIFRKNQRYMDIDVTKVENKNKKKKSSTYLPLKVKRIQGNNNRVKATKSSKSKKKSSLNKK
ncbi:uncharacterized protein [Venturia canescens]|nr:uncharacterized protein LOC122411523 isoform X2 [Venturia canescens]XP_043276328.1 uncharacterized protein LOC122411523 isoform X2 [Venturia canescens]XP_043276329.1 uncharacterized protein LOC122411523 isoform X2 [Venturia canescens]XP_043276330.1 uncharacterized protein LOC122411523 isoform X2 [Venturia canescens]XP_043276331.1 uncharacterized protein LOC122411523 isoform X2 [Venturia canescens]